MLALKYRPRRLSELIGQDVLATVIKNAMELDKVPSAFLLTGSHGIGKTTTARIIACSLMCSNRKDVDPCMTCDSCTSILKFSHPDLVEVDAASNTSISDVKLIIENSYYLPTQSKYRIYIIDEVHMLSNSAFNALLKTLEEPRKYVIFILATTEIKKVPMTIVSRCQVFRLKRIQSHNVQQHLSIILCKEQIQADVVALKIIAEASKGSLRDAISILEQAISYANGTSITIEMVKNILGMSDSAKLIDLISSIITSNAQMTIKIVHELYTLGTEPLMLLQELQKILYSINVCKFSLQNNNPKLEELAKNITIEKLFRMWQALLNGFSEVKLAPDLYITTEMLLTRLCFLSSLPAISEILENQHKFQAQSSIKDSPMIEKIMESFKGAEILDIV